MGGQPVRRHQEIKQALGSFDAGESIRIEVLRGSDTKAMDVVLAEEIPPLDPQRLGVIVRTESSIAGEPEEGEEETSVVIVDGILPDSAAESHLLIGDVIERVGDHNINDVESFRRLMISAAAEESIQLTFGRNGTSKTAEIKPTRIAGKIFNQVPAAWLPLEGESNWSIDELKLPDVGNVAAYVGPDKTDDRQRLGLLVLLLNPGQGSPQAALKDWSAEAEATGVVVCAIAPENNARWQSKELEVVGRFAASIKKKFPIHESAVAVAAAGALHGKKAEAADSMALAVAISQSRIFFGAAVSPETRPPAVRVRENNPSASLQLLLPVEGESDLPGWTAAVAQAGYPVILGGEVDQRILLRWVRLLQSI